MTNSKLKIVDISHLNDTMPSLPLDLIERDTYINTIKKKLENFDVVFVNGDNGVGKTILLADFVKNNNSNTISYFITASDKYTYSPICLKSNLANQILFYSTGQISKETIETDDVFSNLQIPLRRKIRNDNKPLYFVFDGFDEISKQDLDALKPIIDNLPKQAKFIFSGTLELQNQLISVNPIKCTTTDLPPFGIIETNTYFAEFKAIKEELHEIHKIAHNGLPVRLAQLKRLCLETGSVHEFLLNDEISEKTDLFELEWKQVYVEDNLILAFIAFNEELFNLQTISNITHSEYDVIKSRLKSIDFLVFNDEVVSYISEAHKLFARKKLEKYEQEIWSSIIDYYEAIKSSQDSIFNLPNLYQKAKKWNELTRLLSVDAFIQYVEKFQTIGFVKRQIDYGLDASKQLKESDSFTSDYLRFALHKSSFIELEKYEMWESEVEARIVLDEYDNALILANSVILKEDRLKLLAVIAKQRKLLELDVDFQLMDQIKELYNIIDFSEIKEKGFEIANLLIYSNFEIALELIEKIVDNSEGSNSVDMAFAYLTLFAQDANRKSKSNLIDIDLINSKIKDNDAKNFAAAFDFMSDEFNSDEIIQNAKKLDNTSRKIFLLRYWISHNNEKDNIAEVIKYALNEIISGSNESIPNATTLAEIATPLPFIKDFETVKNLVKLFDSQKETINTPTRDYITLQLTIAEALNNFCKKSTQDRFYEIWYMIEEEITDLSIKTDCLCLVWKKLLKIDKENLIENSIYGKRTRIEKRVYVNIVKLLDETAYHFRMVEFVIKTIVTEKPDFILEIIEKLNTQKRKDAALRLATTTYIEENIIDKINFNFVRSCCDKIKDDDIQKDIVITLIDKFITAKNDGILLIPKLLLFKDDLLSINNTIDKCYAITHILKVLTKEPIQYQSLISDFYNKLKCTWDVIDIKWKKIEIGFLITKDLVDFSKEKAKEFLTKTTKLKEDEPLSSNSIVNTYILSTKLCIRAFSGIIQKNRNIDKEFNQLSEIIEQIQSYGEKLKLWNTVALNLKAKSREDEYKRIMVEKIEPMLYSLNSDDKTYKCSIITKIAPSLFYHSQSSFFNTLKSCSNDGIDEAVFNIYKYIFTKLPYNEPIEDRIEGYSVTNSEYIEICTLLNHLSDDYLLNFLIRKIANNIKINKDRLITEEMRKNIIFKLDEIIESKLPNTKTGISHKGYWILSKANLLTLSIYNNKRKEWQNLVELTRLIKNTSDRALVLTLLADIMPVEIKNTRTELMEEAFELIKTIPSNYDKTNRFDASWEIWIDIDKGQFNKHMRIAYNELLSNHDGTLNNLKNIIDVAHQHDKALAENFITLLDQDPARKSLKEPLQKRIESKEQIKLATKDYGKISKLTPSQYVEVFKTNLAQLNSGRMSSKKIEDTYEIVEATAKISLSDAYESISYFIQNVISKNFDKDPTLLLSIFESTYQNAKLVATFSADNVTKMKTLFKYSNSDLSNINPVFRFGEREKFLSFLRSWIERNVKDELTLIDPYFTIKGLDIFKTIIEVKPNCFITILTSKSNGNNEDELELDEIYNKEWKKISVDTPPHNRILIVWDEKTKDCPFHDRWLIANDNDKGLLLNSINAQGEKRDTQVNEMNIDSLKNIEQTVIYDYIYKKKSIVKGFNLRYIEVKVI